MSTKGSLGQVLPQARAGSSSAKAIVRLRRLGLFRLETRKPPGRAAGWEHGCRPKGRAGQCPRAGTAFETLLSPAGHRVRDTAPGPGSARAPIGAAHPPLGCGGTRIQKTLETSQLNLQEDLGKTSCGHQCLPAAAAFPPASFHGLQIPLVNRSLQTQITAGHASTTAGVQGYAAASPRPSIP